MKKYSPDWKTSKNPKKQHKYIYNAPLHTRKTFVRAHLSPDLRKKHCKRSISVRKGDTVQIMRGQFKKKSGEVSRVDLKKMQVYVNGIEKTKKDGSKTLYPIQPSNLMITEIKTEDKKRNAILTTKKKK